jgi:hypothetical protein
MGGARYGWSLWLVACAACGRVGFDERVAPLIADAPNADAPNADSPVMTDGPPVCLELSAAWTPQWASVIEYLPFDGAVGAVANGATITATVGANAAASNVDGTGLAYAAMGINQALRFDGVDDHLTVTMPTIDTTAGDTVSVAFWIQWNGVYYNTASGWTAVLYFTNNKYTLPFVSAGVNSFGFNTNNSDMWGAANSGFVSKWVHVVAEFRNGSSDTSAMFVDGVQQTLTQTLSTANPGVVGTGLEIGAYAAYPTFFGGYLDDLAVWNRALTQAEVQTLYDNQKACYP